jgi:hypothetical protein
MTQNECGQGDSVRGKHCLEELMGRFRKVVEGI